MGYNLFLTIGALLLLGTLMVSTQNLVSFHDSNTLANEYILAAYGAAQSVIDEARTKAYDELTLAAPAADTSGFTAVGSLGRDGSGESVPAVDTMITTTPFSAAYPGYRSAFRFDDVDDYNGYVRLVKASRGFEGDTVRVAVMYVPLDNPEAGATGFRTMCKLFRVTVTGKYLPRPVILPYTMTY